MKQRYEIWASAIAAAALLVACGGDDTEGTHPGANTGVQAGGPATPATAAGNGAAAAGTNGAATPAAGTSGAAPSTAGTAPGTAGAAPGTAGAAPGTAGAAPGTAGTGASGTGGAMAGGQAPQAGNGEAGAGEAGSGGEAGGGGAGSDSPAPTAGSCGPEATASAAELGNPDNPGPWTPTHVEGTGPNGTSWIYHPEELGQDGLKHPVFQWGPGAGTGPSNYLDHLNLLASHGFVIISQPSTQSGREALDWILEENESEGSMWYQKLDPDRVGRGGHSMGALQSFSEADDPRLKLYVLVCGGANGGSGAANIDDPAIFLGGRGEGGTVNFAGDYEEVTGLTAFVTHSDTDHIYCARDNLGPWVAFMRWHFCGEEDKWKQEFMPGGTYCSSPWDECMTKNF